MELRKKRLKKAFCLAVQLCSGFDITEKSMTTTFFQIKKILGQALMTNLQAKAIKNEAN